MKALLEVALLLMILFFSLKLNLFEICENSVNEGVSSQIRKMRLTT